jgi:hypothetical protein
VDSYDNMKLDLINDGLARGLSVQSAENEAIFILGGGDEIDTNGNNTTERKADQ